MESTDRLAEAMGAKYRIERELGSGGMATVYLAHDLRHDRKVAVKVLHRELAAALGGERFLAEIKTTANLQHPHILPLHDSGEADGLLYYVMPFVDGESLRDRLNRERQLPIDDALRIAREVADALAYAHQHAVIHRDIKPENILLQGGHALVADFGIALAVQQAGAGRMTQTGLSLGTPQYMSPEQAMGEKSVDARTDIYSLGVVTYEMLAGEPPFTGPTVQAIVGKVLVDRPRPVTELRRSVPPHVAVTLAAALEKLPADRIRSASDFAAALAGERTIALSAPRAGAAAPRRSWVTHPAITIALLVGAVAALGWALAERRVATAPHAVPRARFAFSAAAAGINGNIIAISPDGSKIVFIERDSGSVHTHLVMRRLDNEQLVALPGTDDAERPFFSPDGESIGFARGNQLLRLDLASGGGPRALTATAPGGDIGNAAWSETGTIAYFAQDGVNLVPASGGQPRRLQISEAGTYTQLAWLPGGKYIVATRSRLHETDYDIVVIAATTGHLAATLAKGVSLGYLANGDLAYISTDASLMTVRLDPASLAVESAPTAVLALSTLGASSLEFFTRALPMAVSSNGTIAIVSSTFGNKDMVLVSENGTVTPLPVGSRQFRGPRFSPDGRRIAVDIEPGGDLVGDIWVYDRGSGAFSRLTFEGSSVFPEWSIDGRSVLYSAVGDTSNIRLLYRVPADRSAPPRLVFRPGRAVFEGVEAAGGTIVFREIGGVTFRDIYVLGRDGKEMPFAAGPGDQRSAAVSRDGRYVAYTSDESGTEEVYVRALDGTARAQVSVNGGTEPRWSPAGRDVYYWSADTLFAAPVTFNATDSPSIGARRRVLVGNYARESNHANYDIAPDGKTFVMLRPDAPGRSGQITVLENWMGGAGSRAGR